MADAPRDENFVPTALFESSTVPGAVAPGQIITATGRIKVDASGGSGTVTQLNSGTGIKLTPDPITTTGSIALVDRIAPIATLGTAGQLIRVNAGATALEYFTASAGGVTSVVGTANRITVDSTDPAAPIVNIAATYVGQTSITTLGTVTTGTLSTGTVVAGVTMTLGSDGTGDIYYRSAGGVLTRLGIGSSTNVLTVAAGLPSWAAPAVQSTITVANEATDTSCFVAFFTDATGNLQPKTNTNMTFNSNTGVVTFASSVLTTTDINGGTVDGTIIGGSSAAAATFTTAIANSFVPNSSSVPSNGLYLPAANTLGWAINGAAEMQLTSTALSPAADGGNSLGTTALGWQNLFGNTGFVINIENSDWVATHTAGILTVGTGDLRVTNNFTNATSVVTVGGAQTLTNKTLTSPTLTTPSAFTTGGTITLAENTTIALDPAGSADGKYTGITVTATAGYTQAFGDLVYLAVADSRWELADADALATAGNVALAMVVVTGTDGTACTLLLQGIIRADAKFPAMTVGATQYVGETAGAIQGAIPTGADNIIRTVGYAITADELYFNPSTDWQVTVA